MHFVNTWHTLGEMDDPHDKQFQMRVSESFLRNIDNWRRARPSIPSRAEAIRQLVAYGVMYSANLDLEEEAEKREKRRMRARTRP